MIERIEKAIAGKSKACIYLGITEFNRYCLAIALSNIKASRKQFKGFPVYKVATQKHFKVV